jgi:hypothetical protein
MSRKRQATVISICKGGVIAQRKIGNDKWEIVHGRPVILWKILLHKKRPEWIFRPSIILFYKMSAFRLHVGINCAGCFSSGPHGQDDGR